MKPGLVFRWKFSGTPVTVGGDRDCVTRMHWATMRPRHLPWIETSQWVVLREMRRRWLE